MRDKRDEFPDPYDSCPANRKMLMNIENIRWHHRRINHRFCPLCIDLLCRKNQLSILETGGSGFYTPWGFPRPDLILVDSQLPIVSDLTFLIWVFKGDKLFRGSEKLIKYFILFCKHIASKGKPLW